MVKAVKSANAANKKAEPIGSMTSNTNIVVAPVEASNVQSAVSLSLTPAETKILARCEKIIGKGLKGFKEVADALQEVRDQNLYRTGYATFEDYCRKKWDLTARHANRLMLAGAVVDNLKSDQLVSPEPLAIPENEAQARPLAQLTPPQQIEVARKVAAKTTKPTTKDFKHTAEGVAGKMPKAIEADEEDAPRVKSYVPNKAPAGKPGAKTGNSNLEKLMELVDQAQTQARKIVNADDVVKMLGDVAKLITRKLNGGGK